MIINGKKINTPTLSLTTWKEDSRLKSGSEDGRRRKTGWVRNIVLHTTKGIPGGKVSTAQYIIPGGKDKGKEFDVAKFFFTSKLSAGAHFVIDTDGSIGQLADVVTWVSYHATTMNEVSVGIEIYQESDGGIWEASLDACVELCKVLCSQLGIQFQVHFPYVGPVDRLQGGGSSVVGIVGHRDQTHNRGFGDPGDFIFNRLILAGADSFNFKEREDLSAWGIRQSDLGLVEDGLPGPKTVAALKAQGYKDGIFAFGKETIPRQKTFMHLLAEFFAKFFR